MAKKKFKRSPARVAEALKAARQLFKTQDKIGRQIANRQKRARPKQKLKR